jgi:LysR family transcriptional regulator, glycine cleavage system transcriptional activator
MSRRLPPLTAIRAFEAVARLGSVKRAATELFVTASAVSHQIKSLENYLGLALFVRERRQLRLTVAGQRYLEAVGHALDTIDIATRRVTSSKGGQMVNVSVAPSFLTRWLVPRIHQFQDLYPDVELRLSPNSGPVDFACSDVDMAVYFGNGDWPDVEAHFLHEVVLVPVAGPRLVEALPPLESVHDLAECTLIDVSTRPDEWDRFLATFDVTRPRRGKRLAFSKTALAVGAAMEDLGIALVDVHLIDREIRYGQLVRPLAVEVPLRQGFYLVVQKGRPLNDGMQAFFDWVLEETTLEHRATA